VAPSAQQVRRALAHLHDLPFAQTHPVAGLAGKALRDALVGVVDGFGASVGGELLRLRYVEALPSRAVAARLALSLGEYYRQHARAVDAVASALRERLAADAGEGRGRGAGTVPRPPTSFVGRERELEEVAALLDAAPLVTLTGVGGAGKTRLATEAAHRAAGRFPDGLFFVDLAPLADPALVAPAFAAAVGAVDLRDEPLADLVVRTLSGRRALVVVDNCEHVRDACAGVVAPLLRACPELRVLATSRAPLGLYGERELPVPPLDEDPAVRLFVDRARQVRPRFAPDPGELDAIRAVCRRLDGLPLALELAAARTRVLSPRALAGQLAADDGGALDLLAGGPRDVAARQRTLRATVEWSHDLLDEPGRRLYRRLAVFHGDLGAEAAGAVADLVGPALWDGLATLVEVNLLAQATPVAGEPRFAMLRTIRVHARERLTASGELDACQERHARFYLALGEDARGGLHGSDRAAWLERMERELDNVRAALRWAVGRGDGGAVLELATALAPLWRARGRALEGLDWLHRGLAVPGADGGGRYPHARARALATLADFARYAGAWPTARELLDEGLPAALEQGDLALASAIHLYVWEGQRWEAQPVDEADPDGLRHRDRGLALARESGDPRALGWALYRVGRAALLTRDYAAARPHLEETLGAAQVAGDRWLEQTTLSQLGHLHHAAGELAAARRLFERSLELARAVGDPEQTAQLMHNLALVHGDEGDQATARALLAAALVVFQRIGWASWGAILVLDALAGVAAAEGNALAALRLAGFAAAQRTRQGFGYPPNDQARLERRLAPARAALSAAEAAAATAAGAALTEEEAIAEARALLQPPAAQAPAVASAPGDP
jgi:predicted ATPase